VARAYLNEVIAGRTKLGESDSLGETWLYLSFVEAGLGQWKSALEACERARQCLRSIGTSDLDQTAVEQQFGAIYSGLRRWKEADESYRKAAWGYKRQGSGHGLAWNLFYRGQNAERLRRFEQAITFLNQALKEAIACGDEYLRTLVYHERGLVAQQQGQWLEGVKFARHSIALLESLLASDRLRDRHTLGSAWTECGCALTHLRQYEEAERAFAKAFEVFAEFTETSDALVTHYYRGLNFMEQRLWDEAERCFHKGIDFERSLHGDSEGLTQPLRRLAECALQRSDLHAARQYLRDADALNFESSDIEESDKLMMNALLAEKAGELDKAAHLLRECLLFWERPDEKHHRLEPLQHLARVLSAAQQLNCAEECSREVESIEQSLLVQIRRYEAGIDTSD